MILSVTRRQWAFLSACETEVLFGGAAGGGKSYGQLADAMVFALRYPGSKQLLLRRTFPELEKSLVRQSLSLFPHEIYKYNATGHVGRFANGSLLDFGYLATENDVFQYQSAEYDVIRFDELTHFTESQYLYLISRVRGANGFPKQVKSSTNPGGIGHVWVKRRFVDPAPPDTPFAASGSTRVFLPAKIEDNHFLMQADPDYKQRLSLLPAARQKALLYGVWDLFEGQFFDEFDREKHVVAPFVIPKAWRRYRVLDYGFDRLACYLVAIAPDGCCYVYRELCRSGLAIWQAAEAMEAMRGTDEVYLTLAPPDLFARSQESGRSRADIFAENGVPFVKTSNDRAAGWMALKELLRVGADGKPRLQIFSTCTELIACLPQLQIDTQNPSDTLREPHAITHAPDALRYFAVYHTAPQQEQAPRPSLAAQGWRPDQWEDYLRADAAERARLCENFGGTR